MERLLALGLTDVFRAWHPQVEGLYLVVHASEQAAGKPGLAAGLLPDLGRCCPYADVAHHTDILGSELPYLPDAAAGLPAKSCPTGYGRHVAGLDWTQLEDELLEYQRAWPGGFCRPLGPCGRAAEEACAVAGRQGVAVRYVVQNDSEAGIDGVRWQTDGEKCAPPSP
ncbi:MAG: hypothetical protein ACLUES_13315 [Flavonifractor plautii]